jgi:predicted ATPase
MSNLATNEGLRQMCDKLVTLVVSTHNELLVNTAKSISGNLIDRPESGFHPSLHWEMLRGKVEKAISTNTRLVIATHSETIVNGVGNLIEEKKLDPELFEIVIAWGDGRLQTASFSVDGCLQDGWPFGFFAPIYDFNFDPLGSTR